MGVQFPHVVLATYSNEYGLLVAMLPERFVMNFFYDYNMSNSNEDEDEALLDESLLDEFDYSFILPQQVREALAEQEALAPIRDLRDHANIA